MKELKEAKIIAGKKYFLLNDVMQFLSIAPPTFKKYRDEADIEPIRIGHSFYITEEDIEKLMESRTQPKHKAGIFRRR